MGPGGAGWALRVLGVEWGESSGAESSGAWGWGALGCNYLRWGSKTTWAEWGRVGLGGVGEGLGMHWDAIKQL